MCVRVCVMYTLFGVGEDVGDLLSVGQVFERTPPAGEVLRLARAAVIDVRPRRHGNLLCEKNQTNKKNIIYIS